MLGNLSLGNFDLTGADDIDAIAGTFGNVGDEITKVPFLVTAAGNTAGVNLSEWRLGGDLVLWLDNGGQFHAINSIIGDLSGTANTANALANNPSDCSSNQFASAIAANGDLTCSSIPNAATTATSANTNSAIVARDGSGNFTAGTITATGVSVNGGASGFVLKDASDPTKTLVFDLSGITTGTQRTVTVPNQSSTWAHTGGSQTFSSKSLTETNFLVDSSTPSKKVGHSLSGASASTTTTHVYTQTTNRNINWPDMTGIPVMTAAAGSIGQAATINSSGVPEYENHTNPRTRFELLEDFFGYLSNNGSPIYLANHSGAAFAASDSTLSVPDNTTIGVMKITIDASTDYWSPSSNNNVAAFMTSGGGEFITETRLALRNLSDGTNTYTLYVGAGDTINGTAPANGIYFYYTHSNNSGKWSCITNNNSTTTQVDSSITVATDTWYILKTVANSAGTRVDCYVATGAGGAFTNIGNSTTNIPTAYPRFFAAPWALFKKTAGSGAVASVWDYMYMRKMVTR
jgi:hypothetical protein